jgi:exopolysaccharide production protein ExoZ
MNVSTDRKQIFSIQYLRAIAALMVVLHHARSPQPWLFNPLEKNDSFASGVHIFFVISGFIMYVAARHEKPFEFLRRRVIRVIPLYWCATIALFILDKKLHVFSATGEELSHILKSLAFIPHYNPGNIIWPYLIPGWTLNYEMFFYFIFFGALISGRVLKTTSIIIIVLFLSGRLFEFNTAVMLTYTSPMLIEFLVGIWVAWMYEKKYLHKYNIWLLPAGFIGMFLLPTLKGQFPLIWGTIVCASIITIGAVSFETETSYNKFAKLLGDASYSIYLTHVVISLKIARKIMLPIPLEGWIQFISWVVLSLSVSILVGVLVYLYFEKPLLKWLRVHMMPAVRQKLFWAQ